MKDRIVRNRFSILLALVVALSVNALTGLVSTGSAMSSGLALRVKTIAGSEITVSSGSVGTATAECPSGYMPVGGGFRSSGDYVLVPPSITSSYTQEGSDYWSVVAVVPKTASDLTLRAYVDCLDEFTS